MNPKIVISGVNLVDLGPLTIYRDALRSLVEVCGNRYEIVAMVGSQELLAIPGVTYMEFPGVKSSWLRRLRFEYLDSFKLSQSLKPVLWIAMHDMTPRLKDTRQVVYCHNPSPFYRFRLNEAILDPKFGLFTLFYRLLYRLYLQRNAAVIVQQDWIRQAFKNRFNATNVIVARPVVDVVPVASSTRQPDADPIFRFVYPAFSRTFKNHAVLLEAVQLLEQRGMEGFELSLTIDGGSNRCASQLFKRFGHLRSVKWLGRLSRDQVYLLYQQAECLIFPSKLETWGLPLTEFKTTGKPILVADLPYAHETIGTYDQVAFFPAEDPLKLAEQMKALMEGKLQMEPVTAPTVAPPCVDDWASLWKMLLSI